MSKYTTQLRFICEHMAGKMESVGYNDFNNVISLAREKIFDFSYPIFDDEYKSVLETKILKHFYTREIGMETYGLWKLRLDTKMNEIMPYYNQLYNSELLVFNPFYDTDITRQHEGESEKIGEENVNITGTANTTESNEGSQNIDVENETINKFSETPQSGLSGVVAGDYLTEATVNNGTGVQNTTTENERVNTNTRNDNSDTDKKENTIDSYIETVKGKQGGKSYAGLLQEFRQTFLNIDMLVVDELENLFMNIY